MIISASRRTDIPCFYSEWFMNRIKAGYALVRNPINNKMISKISLSKEVVDCIVFWTKDPKNIMNQLPILDEMGYLYYFQFTLTPYDNTIEQGLRSKVDIEDTFISLSRAIGKDKVMWRYDPIILSNDKNIYYHQIQFERMCRKLHKYTNSVTISFVDDYKKIKSNKIRNILINEMHELGDIFSHIGKKYGLTIKTCCENVDLSYLGIIPAHCIDKDIIEKISGYPLLIKEDKNQRDGCGCFESIDVGAYNTCRNGCIYCYASYSSISVNRNLLSHNPENELIIKQVESHEVVREKKMVSYLDRQIKLRG